MIGFHTDGQKSDSNWKIVWDKDLKTWARVIKEVKKIE